MANYNYGVELDEICVPFYKDLLWYQMHHFYNKFTISQSNRMFLEALNFVIITNYETVSRSSIEVHAHKTAFQSEKGTKRVSLTLKVGSLGNNKTSKV